MHKVFISYHHANDQCHKEQLVALGQRNATFINRSVETGDVADNLSTEHIRKIIRDKWLRNSTVTIVLVGKDTAKRRHVDWEIYSSMYDGKKNKKSGVLVITLPAITTRYCPVLAPHGAEEKALYSGSAWQKPCWDQYKLAYPSMPDRILDNLVAPEALVSVTRWSDIEHNPDLLHGLIEIAFRDRAKCKYNLSRSMKDDNS